MPLFSEDDFDKVYGARNEIPDGVVDGMSYAVTFENFLNHLEALDVFDAESKMKFMMNVINEVTDESGDLIQRNTLDMITCSLFHTIHIMTHAESILSEMSSDSFVDIYTKSIRQDVLPVVKNECEALPYWE